MVPLGKGFIAVGQGGVGYQRQGESFHKPLAYNLGLGLNFGSSGNGSSLSASVLGFASQDATKRSFGGQATELPGRAGPIRLRRRSHWPAAPRRPAYRSSSAADPAVPAGSAA